MKAEHYDSESFIVTDTNREMFEVFCRLHPHEAYELNSIAFCEFMRKEGFNISDEGIIKLLKETE